jgi:hypothetical protein
VRVAALDTTTWPNPSSNFMQNDIITHVNGNAIGIYNSQNPFFTAIHLIQPNISTTFSYLRNISTDPNVSDFVVQPDISFLLGEFNPANDIFFYGVH